ncbi:MAG: hypothetical protein WEF86_17170 [Gemmatimonadota bacterium]
MTIVGLAAASPTQDECFVWALDGAAEASDGSASIVLTDRPTTPDGWNAAELSGPIIGVSRERHAKWTSYAGDSIRISWKNAFTRGSYALGGTSSGLAGTVTLNATDVIVVDSTGAPVAYTPRTWRVVATARPCPT